MGQLVRAVAAGRSAKELFKTLQKVTVTFNPYDHRSTTAREFLKRVRTPPVKNANPKLKVDEELTEEYGTASIALKYVDGYEQTINSSGRKISDILDEVERVARWKGEQRMNPFEKLREQRARRLGIVKNC